MPEPTFHNHECAAGDASFAKTCLDPNLLQNCALRYAARDLNPPETAAFEHLLANDQTARDALSEAVRLSAAALGQSPPAPHSSYRTATRERLHGWYSYWLARRAYRGHPLTWAGIGALTLAICLPIGLMLTDPEPSQSTSPTVSIIGPSGHASDLKFEWIAPEPHLADIGELAIAPMPHDLNGTTAPASCNDEHAGKQSVAEIWAELSTPDHMEKVHEEELRWRQKLREMGTIHPGKPGPAASEPREP